MKKQSIITIVLSMLMSMAGTKALAYDIIVENADGVNIYYNYINDGKELEVTNGTNNSYWWGTHNSYSGDVVIPEEVSYMNRTRKVTCIGYYAFSESSNLTSVTIPNSVTIIGEHAFSNCSGLNSITIPNSVKSIHISAFYKCSGLTSITIPNSVTSIGGGAFFGCTALTSITIPNSVTSIGDSAFDGCTALTSVTIPNSVKIIEANEFKNCTSLTSITIPNSVTEIGVSAFSGCSSLSSLTIPNNVTSIGREAFVNCRGITTITIGKSVTNIGQWAFSGWDLPEIISMIDNPFNILLDTFSDNTFYNATLYVPIGTIDKYKATEGWKKFAFIVEGNGGGNTPENKKCATPTIGYQNGKLTFFSDTEGATCLSQITDSDITTYSTNEVQLGVTYHISVYATKSGYENSDVATATLCWIDVEPKTEGITDGIATVRANPVLIQSHEKELTITGVPENTDISVYNLAGQKVGSARAISEVTNVNTTFHSGEVAIVKIGDRTIKIVIR